MKYKLFRLLIGALLVLPVALQAQSGCMMKVTMSGLLGDSWDGAALQCYVNGTLEFEAELYSDAVTYDSVLYALDEADTVRLVWVAGLHPGQCGFTVAVGDVTVVSTTNAANSYLDGQLVASFVGCPTCPAPVGLVTSYCTPTTATLKWAGDASATYMVSYRVEGADSYTNAMATTNSLTLTGLDSLKVYEARVRKVCSSTDVSDLSDAILFVTPSVEGGYAAVNYTATMVDTMDSGNIPYYGLPMGQLIMGKTFTQTIVDSAYMAGFEGRGITHFGFNVYNASGASYMNGIAIYMANIEEDTFSGNYIAPNANHVFHLVMGNGNCSFTGTGWKVFELDSVFEWDGHSNVLFSVINNNSSNWNMSPYFHVHKFRNDIFGRKSYWYTKDGTISLTNLQYNGMGFDIPRLTGDLMFMTTAAASTCGAPTGVYPSNLTYHSALLNWNSGGTTAFQLHYTNGSNDNWSDPVVITDSVYQLAGLTELTTYIFQIRGVCIDEVTGDSTFSEWVDVVFTTPDLPCFEPIGLTQSNITFNSASFNWTETGGASLWNLHVWNTQYDSVFTVTSHPFTVNGLTANTDYYVAVSAQCDSVRESIYSDTLAIKTDICYPVMGLTVTHVTSSSATLEWSGGGVGFDVEYGDLHFSEGVNTQVVHVTENSYVITGLQPEYEYSVSVRAECEEGIFSAYCAQVDFTTLVPGEGIEQAGTAEVTLYPNPTSDVTTIAISGVTGRVEVLLVDLSGHEILREELECAGDCVKQLQVAGLAPGAYFVKANGTVRKLIVK